MQLSSGLLGNHHAGVADYLAGFVFVPQNAIKIELYLRTTGVTKPQIDPVVFNP